MSHTKRTLGMAVLLVAALFVITACGSSGSNSGQGTSSSTQKEYAFGAVFPMSGPNSVYGDVFSKGANLAIENINASNKLQGKLKVTYEDSQALAQPAVTAMNKLVTVEKVPFTLSAFSGVSKAIAPIGNRNKVIMVNGGGVSPELSQLGEYFLNDIPLVNNELEALIPYAAKDLNLKRMVVIFVNDPLGQGVVQVMNDKFPKEGGQVVATISIDPVAKDFTAEVAKIRAANPDAIYIASYGQQQNVIIKQLRDGGIKAQLFSYSAVSSPDTLKLAEAQGLIFTNQKLDANANDISKKFAESFKAKYNSDFTPYQANYYNAVLVLSDLIKYCEQNKLDYNGENLLKALKQLKTFNVVGGTMEFQSDGTVKMPIEINQIKDNKYAGVK